MKKIFGYFFIAVFCAVSALAAPASSRSVSVSRIVQKENPRTESSSRGEKVNRVTRRTDNVSQNKNTVSRTAVRVSARENERNNVKSNVVSRVAVNNKKTESRTKANNVVSRAMQSNKQSRGKAIQTRASVVGNSKKKVTAESLAEAKEVLEKTADLNNTCQLQYNECMDQFCAVVDANQKRCSCSSNLAKYQKAQQAVEEASDELNEVAQRIRYVGLSADEIRAIMNATEAEQAMSKNRDNTESRSMLSDIEKMIKDPTASLSYTSSGTDSTLDMDFDFSSESYDDMFSLDMFSTTSSKSSISNKRGKDLYNEAVKRCKSVLNSCKDAGGTEAQITGNYDLAISKDCFEYEQGLQKLNTSLKNNVRSANLMLQKARLSVLQNKNQYDIKGCVGALETCMLDEMVCGTDYIKCLDPTKNYIDENGQVVLGRNIAAITDIMQNYNNSNITSAFIKETADNTTCPEKDGACIVNYLMGKIGKGATVKEGGLCRAVLDKCQDYTYVEKGKNNEYNPYNDVVVNYIQRAMVNIKAAQSKIISDYASTCMSEISNCYNQQMTQLSSWSSNSSSENVYNVLTGACYNVALTCGYAIYAYDIEMGNRISEIENSSDTADTKDKKQKLALIQGVSDLFYNQLLCPDNSFFTNIDKNASGAANRYVNSKCVCKNGYKVSSTVCVACQDGDNCTNPVILDSVIASAAASGSSANTGDSGNTSGDDSGSTTNGDDTGSNTPTPVVTYDITYNYNSVTATRTCSSTETCHTMSADDAYAAGFEKQHYNLIGWSRSETGETFDFGLNAEITISGNINLYPIYERKTYTITYMTSEDAGSSSVKTFAVMGGDSFTTMTLNEATNAGVRKDGFYLSKWRVHRGSSYIYYDLGEEVTPVSDMVLTPNWSTVRYTITYVDTETSVTTQKTCPASACYVMNLEEGTNYGFVKEHYTLNGWKTSADQGTVNYYNLGQKITINGDITLNPIYEEIPPESIDIVINSDNNLEHWYQSIEMTRGNGVCTDFAGDHVPASYEDDSDATFVSDYAVINYMKTQNYDGLKCYVGLPNDYSSFCAQHVDEGHCYWDNINDTLRYTPEMGTYAFYIGKIYDLDNNEIPANGDYDKYVVFDAAGKAVPNIKTALTQYKVYQTENGFQGDEICGNSVIYCIQNYAYLTHVPISNGKGDSVMVPIDVGGYPLFSNLYLTDPDVYDFAQNIDSYAVSLQTSNGGSSYLLSPAISFYDFRNNGYGFTYIPGMVANGTSFDDRFNNEPGLTWTAFAGMWGNGLGGNMDMDGFYSALNENVPVENMYYIPGGLPNIASKLPNIIAGTGYECKEGSCFNAFQLVSYKVDRDCAADDPNEASCYSFDPDSADILYGTSGQETVQIENEYLTAE